MTIAGLILVVGVALTSPSFAQVQQQTAVSGIAEAPEAVQSVIVTARRFHVEPQEFANYEYAYPLSNGKTLRFSRRVGRFYVEIKGYERLEILASGPGQFVSKGGVTLTFTEDGDALAIDNYELLQQESGCPIVYAFGASN